MQLLEENTRLTEQIHKLSTEIHQRVNAAAS
jgi:cell division septum initiation protein DivIVA